MLRIGILQPGYEVNTFALGKATFSDMGPLVPANEVLAAFRGGRSSAGGAIWTITELQRSNP